MRLTRILLLLSFVLPVLASCAVQDSVADSITSVEDVPPFEEFSGLPDSEKLRIKMGIEDIPVISCSSYYESFIQDYLQEDETVRLRGVSVEQDNLSLAPGKNQKSLLNLVMRIDLEMDTAKTLYDSWDIARELASNMIEYLRGDTFYALKIKQCIISTYDPNGYLIKESERRAFVTDESIFREQPETEYAAQSIAYDYYVENTEFVLDKFGAILETKELYVEYYVEDSYFGRGSDEIKRQIDNLENIADDIKDHLLITDSVDSYISENSLNILTISFRNGILEDFSQVFPFKL